MDSYFTFSRRALPPRTADFDQIGLTNNKFQKYGAFFRGVFVAVFHHVFTTFFTRFTTLNTTFCTPVFAKPPVKTPIHHAEKKAW